MPLGMLITVHNIVEEGSVQNVCTIFVLNSVFVFDYAFVIG